MDVGTLFLLGTFACVLGGLVWLQTKRDAALYRPLRDVRPDAAMAQRRLCRGDSRAVVEFLGSEDADERYFAVRDICTE